MNYSSFGRIADKVLLQNLKRSVASLGKVGWWPAAIASFAYDEVSGYNRSNSPKVLLGELNRFLWEHNLPTITGNDAAPVP